MLSLRGFGGVTWGDRLFLCLFPSPPTLLFPCLDAPSSQTGLRPPLPTRLESQGHSCRTPHGSFWNWGVRAAQHLSCKPCRVGQRTGKPALPCPAHWVSSSRSAADCQLPTPRSLHACKLNGGAAGLSARLSPKTGSSQAYVSCAALLFREFPALAAWPFVAGRR